MQHRPDKLIDFAVIQHDKSVLKRACATFAVQADFNGFQHMRTKLTLAFGACGLPFTISLRAA